MTPGVEKNREIRIRITDHSEAKIGQFFFFVWTLSFKDVVWTNPFKRPYDSDVRRKCKRMNVN